MKYLHRTVRYGACALGMSLILAACSNSTQKAQSPTPPPAQIQGIATPSSVAVVTATNAG